ncbi:sucrose nonfermenting 4-like protein isoform X3 [Primulina huaijiensis]|uniref:sucrose nonfermenting 4-like protein isoform X3 n=1 Tax=Primulina huaijiensis TaxID=1492673 RepID=UPI003CC72F7A
MLNYDRGYVGDVLRKNLEFSWGRFFSVFNAAMDYANETGMVLIPTRFVWPYGGRDIYISGSFTGWTPWPMTPVEGCPTVFQTICSLPRGYHQYKFVVDGEWRHDEHQPFISSNIGTVNTILLNRDSDFHSALLSPQMPHSGHVSSMDVDNKALQHMIHSSDGVSNGPLPTMSDADLAVSQHRIGVFLSTHMAYELLPESGKGISLAPLWDFSKKKFVGVLSALDFILIMRELGSHGSNPTEEELETHTISAWKEAKSYMNNRIDGQGSAVSRQLVHAGPDDSLKEVALKILQNGAATVPIIHSPSEDASNQHLLFLASLSGILKCVCRFFKNSTSVLPVLQLPICAIPVGTWLPKTGEPKGCPLALLRPSASLSTALNLLIQAQVSSIPIVDDNDSLLDIYSRSDITSLTKDKLYTHINLEETTIHQALQYRDDPFSTHGYTSQKCHMCLRSDPLYKVMERLSKPEVRRVVIVEAGSKRVEGIISLSDVFRFLLGT